MSKITAELRCGDLLIAEYGSRRAYYRIVWVLELGGHGGTRVAVHKVGERPCPWEELLPITDMVSG